MALTRRQLWGWTHLLLATLLAVGAWGLLVVLSTQPRLKYLWDVSPQARFSVEAATEELLRQVAEGDETLEFHTLFVPLSSIQVSGPEGDQLRALHQRLQELTRDLLRQYAYLGGDAVEVTHHDLLGEPKDVKVVMREFSAGRYNSVIAKLGKRSKVLHLLDDLADLDVPTGNDTPMAAARPSVPRLRSYKGEEAISSAVKRLMVEGTPKVYLLTGYSRVSFTEGIAASYSELIGALADDGFDVAYLDLGREGRIPEDAGIVALVEPDRELEESDADLLLGFLRRGGRVFVNTAYVDAAPDFNPSLRALGARVGFELSSELVCQLLQDPNNPGRLASGTPQVTNLEITDLNPTHPVTRPMLRQRRYPKLKAARAIRRVEGAEPGIRLDTRILRTGEYSWLERRPVDYFGPPEEAGYAPVSVGAIADVDPDVGDRTGHLALVSGAAFVNLGFQVNGDLALNLFNWMAERDALITIRGNKYVARSLDLKPQQVDRIFWLLVPGVPGALLALGFVVFWRRSRS